MALHATLSPSSASRWISCPASVRMSQTVAPQSESSYATEGTAAHALAELKARHHLIGKVPRYDQKRAAWIKKYDISDEAEAEMTEHADRYVAYLQARLAEHPGAQLLLEQRLPTGVPDSWGTSDAVMVSPVWIEIVDFKYGLGIRVDAEANPQLRLYAVGALEAYGDLLGEVLTVGYTVFQPRLDHIDTEEIPASELRVWRDSLLPVAQAALGPDAPFGPSESACRWCPASGQCPAQLEWATNRDFAAPVDTLDSAELADALDRIPFIKQWCAAVESHCLDRVYSKGQPVPGYKVVISGGKRSVVDHIGALEAATALGFEPDQVSTRKMMGIGELKKLLKGSFDGVMGPFVKKGDGSPSLVPDSDKRGEASPEASATVDFGDPPGYSAGVHELGYEGDG